ncbi:TIM-barrel domain-containing protein [Terriglobus aquaticus]|uniref:TIM-barrel domain-containing protein n=1 Tax=Terriglobus aquaticus TaxID=940139 RepID=A0ABW9KIP6_9BACT|nr:TIM-barrel domain-containing protein [Terriglobus aquaticus]
MAPGIWKATIGAPEAATPVRSRRVPPALQGLGSLAAIAHCPLPIPEFRITQRGTELNLPLAEGELMYGFGLQLLSFQQRSKKRTIRVNADPKVDSGDSHAPVPFYVTTRGYGVLIDTFRQATFYCGEAHPKPTQAESASSLEVNTPQRMRVRDRDLQGSVRIEAPRCAGLDVYVFGGPTMLEAVQRYNLFSGGGVLPPEWGLGFWYRAEMHLNGDEVLKLAESLRADAIPCDVLGLEPGWQTHAYSCTFAWDRHRFPEPSSFIQQAASEGFRVNLWEHAFTHPASPIFAELVPFAGDIAVWDGLVPDFAAEGGRRVFGGYHGRELIDRGISGFKLDECDNSDFTEGWSFPDNSRFPSGIDGEQMHAQFGLRYQDTIWDEFRKRGTQTYGLVRSSGALAAPYPFVLYSDLYDHRQFVRALVNSGFSGLLWCPEVRDASSAEDLVRRLQTVVLSPLAMVNAWYIRNPPWKQMDRDKNNRNEFSEGWEALQARCQEIIGMRMQLLPYLRGAFARYRAEGVPPFRALVMDFPDDPSLAAVDDQYLIGDRLMAAPLFAGEAVRNIVFPPGQWQDFWTGAMVTERKITVQGSTRNIPLYIKAGSLMPWAEVGPHTGAAEARRLSVRVYGDGHRRWSAPHAAGGLQLAWQEGKGGVQQPGSQKRPFVVTGWERIGS